MEFQRNILYFTIWPYISIWVTDKRPSEAKISGNIDFSAFHHGYRTVAPFTNFNPNMDK